MLKKAWSDGSCKGYTSTREVLNLTLAANVENERDDYHLEGDKIILNDGIINEHVSNGVVANMDEL